MGLRVERLGEVLARIGAHVLQELRQRHVARPVGISRSELLGIAHRGAVVIEQFNCGSGPAATCVGGSEQGACRTMAVEGGGRVG